MENKLCILYHGVCTDVENIPNPLYLEIFNLLCRKQLFCLHQSMAGRKIDCLFTFCPVTILDCNFNNNLDRILYYLLILLSTFTYIIKFRIRKMCNLQWIKLDILLSIYSNFYYSSWWNEIYSTTNGSARWMVVLGNWDTMNDCNLIVIWS
jgi:hypothetical protein